jgi:hypothetical protein
LGLFSWITLAADALLADGAASVQQAAWYAKRRPTFADALAWVRKPLWLAQVDETLWPLDAHQSAWSHPLFDRLFDTVSYAT